MAHFTHLHGRYSNIPSLDDLPCRYRKETGPLWQGSPSGFKQWPERLTVPCPKGSWVLFRNGTRKVENLVAINGIRSQTSQKKRKKEKSLNSEIKRFKKTRQSTPEKEARFLKVIKAMRD